MQEGEGIEVPIKGLSDVRRFPRIGKIRLGVKAVSQRSGAEYPKAVDYYVVDPDDGVTSPAAAAAFTAVYGPKPQEIDILFPTDDREQLFPQWLKRYGSGSGLLCKGDGETAQAVDKATGELVDTVCNPEECPYYRSEPPQCRRVGSLHFLLPSVAGLGCWVIETTSWYSIVNVNSGMDFISCLTGGRIAMIPLKLRLKPQEVAPGGKKKTVYVLSLSCEEVRLQDVLDAAKLPAPLALIAPLDEAKAPDDLYARSVREAVPHIDVVKVVGAMSTPQAEPEVMEPTEVSSTPAPEKASQSVPGDNDMTEPQRKAIFAIARKRAVDEPALDALIEQRYGVQSKTELTKQQASDLIEHLQALTSQAPAAPDAAGNLFGGRQK